MGDRIAFPRRTACRAWQRTARHSPPRRWMVVQAAMEPITKRGQGRRVPLQTRTCVLSGGLDQLIPRRYLRLRGTTRQRPCPRLCDGLRQMARSVLARWPEGPVIGGASVYIA